MLLTSEAPIGGEQRLAYQAALESLRAADVDFLVGGGFALHQYLGRWRSTKDLDLFLRAGDVPRALEVLEHSDFHVEMTDPGWLAKATRPGTLVDLIFSSYNKLFPVDNSWFENGRAALVLGIPVNLVGPEEMLVSKAFVAARDRFDGSDIAWLIRALGDTFDWQRIAAMMDTEWEVLLWQLVHYRYVFPRHRHRVPEPVLTSLLARMNESLRCSQHGAAACRGQHFDSVHYLGADTPEVPSDYEPPF